MWNYFSVLFVLLSFGNVNTPINECDIYSLALNSIHKGGIKMYLEDKKSIINNFSQEYKERFRCETKFKQELSELKIDITNIKSISSSEELYCSNFKGIKLIRKIDKKKKWKIINNTNKALYIVSNIGYVNDSIITFVIYRTSHNTHRLRNYFFFKNNGESWILYFKKELCDS